MTGLWQLPDSYGMSDVMIISKTNPMPKKIYAFPEGTSWGGDEDPVKFVALFGALAEKINIEEILKKLFEKGLKACYYLPAYWTDDEAAVLCEYLSAEVINRSNGLYFEVIHFRAGGGRVGILANE